jgi:hypothetical protein
MIRSTIITLIAKLTTGYISKLSSIAFCNNLDIGINVKESLQLYLFKPIIANKFQSESKALFEIMERSYSNRRSSSDSFTDGLVLDDFSQILDAIFIFKQVYGDLDISTKFEVPAAAPWPPSLHGLRLGKRLQKLFSTREFFIRHPEKVREISNLGLIPSEDSLIDDWTLLFKSMKVYKELYGNLRISSKFQVPENSEEWPRVCRGVFFIIFILFKCILIIFCSKISDLYNNNSYYYD